jgi:hypothetical protein
MKEVNKLSLQLSMAVILVIFGIALITASFIVPPLGVIDSSVLVAYGETLTFVGALVGVDYTYKYKVKNTGDN